MMSLKNGEADIMIKKVQQVIFIILLITLGVLIFLSIPAGGLKDEYNWKGKSYSDSTALQSPTVSEIIVKLRQVKDPELSVDIIDLGLIYDLKITEGELDIVMTLTFKRCPYAAHIIEDVKSSLTSIDGIKKIRLKMTFDPAWSWERVSPEVRASIINNMKQLGIIEEGEAHE